jgi:hypothetical protein
LGTDSEARTCVDQTFHGACAYCQTARRRIA